MGDLARPDPLAKEIGSRIVSSREALGWSQQALSVRTKQVDPERKGISRSVLSLYETGTNKPGAREIRILCETLSITPNWLFYGRENPGRTAMPSFAFLRGDEFDVAMRLAFGILVLDPVDRDSLAALALSLLEKRVGDLKQSSIMIVAHLLRDPFIKTVIETAGEGADKLSIRDLLKKFEDEASTSFTYSNYGNARPVIPDEKIDDYGPDNLPPPRKLPDAP